MPTAKKFTLLLLIPTLLLTGLVYADTSDEELKEIEEKLEEKQEEYQSTSSKLSDIRDKADAIASKVNQLASELNVTQAQINELGADIKETEEQLAEINTSLEDRRKALAEKIALRNTVIRNYAKHGMLNNMEMFLLNMPQANLNGFQYSAYAYIFEKTLTSEALSVIGAINKEIISFEKDKKEAEDLKNELETSQRNLVAVKEQLDAQKFAEENVLGDLSNTAGSLEGDLAELEKEIAELSEKQQAILQAKSGDFSASLSEGVETDDPRTSINYNPGFSPAFAAFSYGAYTHRNGMSQYGALGRAKDGQDYDEILEFYYDTGIDKKDGIDDDKICVEGHVEMSLGKYLRGLGEMPPSWHEEALKAQAVAARTYAYRYMKKDKCICTSTNCQYFHKDLIDRSDRERWYDAIKDTEDRILEGDVSAQYSSTTGGWINGVGWDKDGGSWPKDAYEKKAGSPWFFKAWFTQTYRKDSSTCGRKSPWLTGEEMADILNAYLLIDAGKNTERIVPETINKCPISGFSGKPYSKEELRSKAKSATGKSFSKVTGVDDPSFSDGRTTKITFQTTSGGITVDGQTFMKAFNLRAPGYIAIKYTPDNKALYAIEKK